MGLHVFRPSLHYGGQCDGITHTERVLYVNEPAIEAVTVADLDEFISHSTVRLLVFQEGLAGRGSVCPLCDESPWKGDQSQCKILQQGPLRSQ